MEDSKLVTLLSGTQINFDQTQSVLLPEVHDDLQPGDIITLENEKREFVAEAEVVSVEVESFALLQRTHLEKNAHPELRSLPNAYSTLRFLVPGFSQSDKVSIIALRALAVSDIGLTIVKAEPAPAEDVPSEAEMFAALNEAE